MNTKKRFYQVVSFLTALVVIFTAVFAFNATPNVTVKAADGTTAVSFVRGEKITYNDYHTYRHTVVDANGQSAIAFCMEPEATHPDTGVMYTPVEIDNALIKAILYYGYGGPGYDDPNYGLKVLVDANTEEKYMYCYTHCMVAYAYDDCSDDSDGFQGLNSGGTTHLKRVVATWNSISFTVPSRFKVFMTSDAVKQNMVFWSLAPESQLKLKKTSAYPEITDGSSCYSYTGAVYGVYTDAACTNKVAELTTTATGDTNTVTLDEGTYYVKELVASPGFMLDTEVHSVTTVAGQTSTVTSTEPISNDPILFSIHKKDLGGGNIGQGGATLAGAQFTVKYYDGFYSADTLPATPSRTWVLETREEVDNGVTAYYARLEDAYKVGGDEFYYSSTGKAMVPLGTITIEETKAPNGYLIDGNEISVGGNTLTNNFLLFQVTQNASSGIGEIAVGNDSEFSDVPIKGSFEITKVDADTLQAVAQGGATLAGAQITIYNENDNPVNVNGTDYAKDQAILTLTTNENGYASVGKVLPYGSYYYKETAAPTGYLLNNQVYHFSITTDGQMVTKTISDTVKKQTFEITKVDADTLQAVAQGDAALAGAEITIYSNNEKPVVVDGTSCAKDQAITTITTDENGYAALGVSLPYGSYYYKETKAPEGYLNIYCKVYITLPIAKFKEKHFISQKNFVC